MLRVKVFNYIDDIGSFLYMHYHKLEDYTGVHLDVDYISLEADKLRIYEKNGSIYKEQNGSIEYLNVYDIQWVITKC